jgi:GTP-binding protein
MKSDRAMLEGLDERAVSHLLVLTKADALKPAALATLEAALGAETRRHVAAFPEVMATSARSGLGLPEVRAHLAALALPEPSG